MCLGFGGFLTSASDIRKKSCQELLFGCRQHLANSIKNLQYRWPRTLELVRVAHCGVKRASAMKGDIGFNEHPINGVLVFIERSIF